MSVIESNKPDTSAVEHHPLDAAAQSGDSHPRTTRSARPILLTGLAFTFLSWLAFNVRSIGLSRSFELWVDEMLYADLGRSVSLGQLPNLPDGPFFLHPPGFYFLEGLVISRFNVSDTSMNLVYDLRWINAVIGALTVGIAFLLVRRIGNKPTAWIVAVVLAFEPFVLRNNSRVFLETLAVGVALAGLLIVVVQLTRRDIKPGLWWLAIAGLLMGYAVLTKDFLVLYTAIPVVLAVFWKRTLQIRQAVVLLCGIVAPYLAYVVILSTQGLLGDWFMAKSSGAERLMGLEQSTGFNAVGSPSIVARMLDQLSQFGTSYVLLALCPVVGAFACFSAVAARRLIGLATLSMGLFGAYSAAFGTFEEHYGYGVVVASVIGSAACAADWMDRRPGSTKPLAVAGIVFLLATVGLGLRAELTQDNGYQQAAEWVAENLPASARVSVSNSTGEFAFADDARFGVWPSAPLMAESGANYILTQSLPTTQGYGYAQPGMLTWLAENGTKLFETTGPTNGATTLWYVDDQSLAAGAAAGIGYPSATYETER
jgi:hypothetical protein